MPIHIVSKTIRVALSLVSFEELVAFSASHVVRLRGSDRSNRDGRLIMLGMTGLWSLLIGMAGFGIFSFTGLMLMSE